jgi:hypothetical protein
MLATAPRLTDPGPELLDSTDVFIFDCDGMLQRRKSVS